MGGCANPDNGVEQQEYTRADNDVNWPEPEPTGVQAALRDTFDYTDVHTLVASLAE